MRQGCSYTVECLLSKLENLGSILAITKKKTNVKYQQESLLDPYGFFRFYFPWGISYFSVAEVKHHEQGNL